MNETIQALSEINVPTALVIFGIILLFLGLAGRFGTYVEIRRERQNLVALVGALILVAGVGLSTYAALGLPQDRMARDQPPKRPPATNPIRWIMAGSYTIRDTALSQQDLLLDRNINAIVVKSEQFEFLCPGFYTVMVLSPNLDETGPLLTKVQKVIPDAYPRNPNTFDRATC